jgi:hypothetical protein
MKKKYIYMLVPLCGVIVFCLFYIPFANHYADLQVQKHKEEIKERDDKLQKEADDRIKESQLANEAAEKRKAEHAAKLAREKAEEDALAAADAARVKAHNDEQKYKQQVADLTKAIKLEQAAVAALQATKEDTLKEQDFLKSYVQQAEDNRQKILGLLDKLAAAEMAEKAREDEAIKKASNNS